MKRPILIAFAVVLFASSCGGDASPTTTVAAEVAVTTSAAPATTSTSEAQPTTTSTSTTTTTAPPTTTVATTTTTTVPPTTTTTTTVPPTTTTTTTTTAPTTTTVAVDYVAIGSELATNLGCRNCHSTDGSVGLGPSWAGLAGSSVPLEDGSTVTASGSYLAESIRSPDSKIVAGFAPGVMQVVSLNDEEILALVAYISSL